MQPKGTAAAVAAVAAARSRSNYAGGVEGGGQGGVQGGGEEGLSDLESGDSASAPSSVVDEEEDQELIEEMAAILNQKDDIGKGGELGSRHQSRRDGAASLSPTAAAAAAATTTATPAVLPRSVSVSVAPPRRPDIGHTEYEIRGEKRGEEGKERRGAGASGAGASGAAAPEAPPLLAVVRFRQVAALGEEMRKRLRRPRSSLPGASAWAALEASRAARGGARLSGEVVSARRLAMEEGLNACLAAVAAAGEEGEEEKDAAGGAEEAAALLRQLLSTFLLAADFREPSSPPPPSHMRLLTDPVPDPPPSDAELLSAQRGSCPSCGERVGLPSPPPSSPPPPRGTAPAPSSVRCEYCVALQCQRCCSGRHRSPLPRLVVASFDFSRRPVCDAAAEFLRGIRSTPLIHIPSSPSSSSSLPSTDLYSRVPSLRAAREARARASAAVAAAAASASAPAAASAEKAPPSPAPPSVAAALLAAAARAGRDHLLRRGEEDWWSLAELEDDLHSRGAFASLPGWLEAVAAKANAAVAAAAAKR